MPNIVREDIDQLNAKLTVTVERAEYEPLLNAELQKYRKQASLKGFRKGKTPLGVVRKLYGKGLLAEVVNDLLQRELYNYLINEKVSILGQPLSAEDQPEITFDLRELTDYEFRFDIGLTPEFEVTGVDADNTFEKYEAEVTDKMVEEELDNARRRQGERVYPEEEIREQDLLKLSARELDGDEVKTDGISSEFSLLVDNVTDEAVRTQLLAAKNGDVLRLNLFTLEEGAEEKFIRRYYLNLEETDEREVGQEYEVTIEEVSRIEPAEMNQEFFDKMFGPGEVSSEEEARERIRSIIRSQYDKQSEALLYRDFQDDLMERNEIPLPDAFLLRWLKSSNEEVAPDDIEKEYEAFAQNLRWSLIRNKLIRRFELEVAEQEIRDRFKEQIRGYFGGASAMGDEFLDSMAQRMMGEEKQVEQVREELMADKLYDAIAAEVTLQPRPISTDELQKIIEAARAEQEAAQGSQEEE